MSDLLHRTRLRWSEALGSGVATHDGVRVELHRRPPVLLGLWRLIELDYVPGVGVAYYQLAMGPREDMSGAQIAECLQYLRDVASAAKAQVDTWRPGSAL